MNNISGEIPTKDGGGEVHSRGQIAAAECHGIRCGQPLLDHPGHCKEPRGEGGHSPQLDLHLTLSRFSIALLELCGRHAQAWAMEHHTA